MNGTSPNTNSSNSTSAPSDLFSPREEIQCYALPYGALGFISDLLTFYTAWRLSRGKKPLWFGDLSTSRAVFIFNICLSFVTLNGTYVAALITIYRCRGSWQVELIAAYKLVLSLTIILMGLHAAVMARIVRLRRGSTLRRYYRKYDQHRDTVILWGRTLYSAGAVVGAVGLLTLAYAVTESENEEDIRATKYLTGFSIGFSIAVIIGTAVYVIHRRIYRWGKDHEGTLNRVLYFILAFIFNSVFVFSLFFALYCDWALASITEDWVGTPSRHQHAVYWVYFAAKRLPLLMQ